MKQRPSKYQRVTAPGPRKRRRAEVCSSPLYSQSEVRLLLEQMEHEYQNQLSRYHAAMQEIGDGYTTEDRTHELAYLS